MPHIDVQAIVQALMEFEKSRPAVERALVDLQRVGVVTGSPAGADGR